MVTNITTYSSKHAVFVILSKWNTDEWYSSLFTDMLLLYLLQKLQLYRTSVGTQCLTSVNSNDSALQFMQNITISLFIALRISLVADPYQTILLKLR